MVYDVKYQVAGEEHVDRVVAPHAAGAAEHVRVRHDDGISRFELLLVHLLDDVDAKPVSR